MAFKIVLSRYRWNIAVWKHFIAVIFTLCSCKMRQIWMQTDRLYFLGCRFKETLRWWNWKWDVVAFCITWKLIVPNFSARRWPKTQYTKNILSCLSTVIKNKHKHCPSRLLPSNFKRKIGGECFFREVGGRQCPNLTALLCFSNKAFKNKQLHWRSHTWRLAFRDLLNTAQGLASPRQPNRLIILSSRSSVALCVHRPSAYN